MSQHKGEYENPMFKIHSGPHPLGEHPVALTPPYSCGVVYERNGYSVLRMEMGKSRYEYDIVGRLGKVLKHTKTKREAVEIVNRLP